MESRHKVNSRLDAVFHHYPHVGHAHDGLRVYPSALVVAGTWRTGMPASVGSACSFSGAVAGSAVEVSPRVRQPGEAVVTSPRTRLAHRRTAHTPQPVAGSLRSQLPWIAASVLAVGCWLLVTAVPVPTGDLYVALAGGRDALAGRLGKPDDWSFSTAGRVWVNQNWGSGVLFYLTHSLGGEEALLALKAALTLAVLAGMVALARSTGASWAAALLVASAGLWAARRFPELRPNLLTLILAPVLVWLLRSSLRKTWRLVAAVGLVTVWANMHGGFLFGLLVLALWAVASGAAAARCGGLRSTLKGGGPAVGACLVGVLLAGLATPFGWTNLTFSLRLADPAWRTVREWVPMSFTPHELFGSPWEFLAIAMTSLAVVTGRLVQALRAASGPNEAQQAAAWFDLAVAVAAIAMALSAWRFVGVALVVLTPLVAPVVDRVLQPARRGWPTLVAVGVLVMVAWPFAGRVLRHYRPDHPRFGKESFFYRMLELDAFPRKAAEFLAGNDVRGRVYNEWRWEGYLRWVVPRLRLFVGGRAQQIYDWPTVERALAVPSSPAPATDLAKLGVEVVVVPMHLTYDHMVERLALRESARWLIVYYDGRDAVLVDSQATVHRVLVDRLRQGGLRYPNPAIAAVSRALFLACPTSGASPAERVAALTSAAREMPTIGVYWALAAVAARGELETLPVLAFLEEEQARLGPLDHRQGGGVDLLKAKYSVAWQLSRGYAALGRGEDAARWSFLANELRSELWSLLQW